MHFEISQDDDALKITLVGQDMEKFKRTSLWKMKLVKLKVNCSKIEGQTLFFPSSLTKLQRDEIVSALNIVTERGYEVIPSRSYLDSKEVEDSKIREKSRVGLAIKSHDDSVRENFETFRNVINQIMVRPLFDMQAWDAFFMCSIGKTANFSVPGSGKTASSLGVFAYLFSKKLVKRVVVISPKNAFGSWRDEWVSCFGANIPCNSLCFHDVKWNNTTSSDRNKELTLNVGRYNLILLNYEALGNYEAALRSLIAKDTLLVFDEIHKIKRIGGIRASSAIEASKDADYVIALTGTPIPNSYCDIYNLLNILYPKDYDLFFGFTPDMLNNPSSDGIQRINESLQPFFCRTNKQSLHVPEASPDRFCDVVASDVENRLLNQLMNIYKKDRLALIIRIMQMESDPEMLLTALDETEFDGLIDESPFEGITSPVDTDTMADVLLCKPTSKFNKCIDVVSSLVREGKSVVVWCFFRQSMQNITATLNEMGYSTGQIHGGIVQEDRQRILDDFKSGSIRVLVTNPQTLAESVSLHSICHDAVYFEYSYNLVHLLQSKDRIHRLGLPDGQYTQYHFLRVDYKVKEEEWSLDKRIYDRLHEKEEVMLEAIDRGVLESGSTDERDLDAVFEGLF